MISLKELIGTVVFSQNGNYIVGATDRQNAEFQAKCQRKLDIDVDALRARMQDSVEIKGISEIKMTSENYNDILKVKGMPSTVFVGSFGEKMEDEITDCMSDYYSGKKSKDDVKAFFEECCSSMRIYCAQQRLTTGKNEADNQQIVGQVFEMFSKCNQRQALAANREEGIEINRQYGGDNAGKVNSGYAYYNAFYYHECEAMRDVFRDMAGKMTDKWGISEIDTCQIEQNTSYTLDGGLDFNSGWNFKYRNNVGVGSMIDEGIVPPKDFKMFFNATKGNSEFAGILYFECGDTFIKTEVPFEYKGNDVFNVSELIKFKGKDKGQEKEINAFLRNFEIFTVTQSSLSQMTLIRGNHQWRLL